MIPFFCLIGKNGSGKTTLLKILAGIFKPKTGTVFVCDEEIWPQKVCQYEHKSLYMAYRPALYEGLSIEQNIQFYLNCYAEHSHPEKVHSVLSRLNLNHKSHMKIEKLSQGQKRRTTLAILTLLKPHLVLMDEPTNGLDTKGVDLCFEVFEELQSQHKTALIIASHDSTLLSWSSTTFNIEEYGIPSQQNAQKQGRISYNLF